MTTPRRNQDDDGDWLGDVLDDKQEWEVRMSSDGYRFELASSDKLLKIVAKLFLGMLREIHAPPPILLSGLRLYLQHIRFSSRPLPPDHLFAPVLVYQLIRRNAHSDPHSLLLPRGVDTLNTSKDSSNTVDIRKYPELKK